MYDEFGNYIGPDLASESEDENEYGNVGDDAEDRERSDEEMEEDKDESREQTEQGSSMTVVLHEDKRYYPSALEVYGPEVIKDCFKKLRTIKRLLIDNFFLYVTIICQTIKILF